MCVCVYVCVCVCVCIADTYVYDRYAAKEGGAPADMAAKLLWLHAEFLDAAGESDALNALTCPTNALACP